MTQERELERRRAYWATFLGPDNQPHPNAALMLKSFRKFCRVDRPGIVVSPVQKMTDPYATAYQAGLRDAYSHIDLMLKAANEQTLEKDDARGDSSIDE